MDPPRNMPRALLIAIPIIMLCYILANVAFFAVLEKDQMANFTTNAVVDGFVTVFGADALGTFGQVAFPIMIAASAFGSLDGGAFVGLLWFRSSSIIHMTQFRSCIGSRVVYASAMRGDFPKTFQMLYSPKKRASTPLRALVFEGELVVIHWEDVS